jgi:HPt (histidine-containing phosphotransfer) domain-containing protein
MNAEACMANVPGNVGWIAELIPDVMNRVDQYIVDTEDVDDELIEVFIEELRRLTDELVEGVETSNPELVRAAAHSIKGMGGTIGLPEVSVFGFDVEMTAKEDRLADAKPLVDGLVNWVATL